MYTSETFIFKNPILLTCRGT